MQCACVDSDPIPTWLLKKCSSVLIPTITDIVIHSLGSGTFDPILKESTISHFLKKSTLDKDQLMAWKFSAINWRLLCFTKTLRISFSSFFVESDDHFDLFDEHASHFPMYDSPSILYYVSKLYKIDQSPGSDDMHLTVLVLHWRFGVAVTRWSRSTQLLYIEPG